MKVTARRPGKAWGHLLNPLRPWPKPPLFQPGSPPATLTPPGRTGKMPPALSTSRAVREKTGGKNEHIAAAIRALEQEGYVQSNPGPRNSTLYSHVRPFQQRTPPPAVFAPEDDEDFEDEMDETLTKSLGTPPVLPGPTHKGVGTRNQSNRQVPGTTGNHSGTTTANGEPEKNRGRRTPLAGWKRVR
jgi:DNA-binding transcriptional MocR family regulator